jgi:hypothetical protein
MQQYLTTIGTIERPPFKDVMSTRSHADWPAAFKSETTETYNLMAKVKSSSAGAITTGLWPLDHESYYDWRHTSHKKEVWKQWIYMARIEEIIVKQYRARMFRKCSASAFIRNELATALSPFCTSSIVPARSRSQSSESSSVTQFHWPDNITIVIPEPQPEQAKETTMTTTTTTSAAGAQTRTKPARTGERPDNIVQVDHEDAEGVRSNQLRQEETIALTAEVTAVFKRLHSLKSALAVRGQPGYWGPIVDKLDDLEFVCIVSY